MKCCSTQTHSNTTFGTDFRIIHAKFDENILIDIATFHMFTRIFSYTISAHCRDSPFLRSVNLSIVTDSIATTYHFLNKTCVHSNRYSNVIEMKLFS